MKVKILYFANLADQLDTREESVDVAEGAKLSQLKQRLAERGQRWQDLLHAPSTRCAINQDIATDDTLLANNDEVAFFPPVTGG